MGAVDNRRTVLLCTYVVKNVMLGSKFLWCCVNVMSRVPEIK